MSCLDRLEGRILGGPDSRAPITNSELIHLITLVRELKAEVERLTKLPPENFRVDAAPGVTVMTTQYYKDTESELRHLQGRVRWLDAEVE